ncbi:Polypeptide N-acetylgalactosaminyltransferase [Aphelenchoides besseyi]|nr:Polypeptide N-acetylgalactosaminyltransferase [Aphelenchoides besseyi]KAI6200548.1 Polypeptide N-acetylgalactosaminyltransferase [Aphelenchoides besseyi]
MPFRVGRYIPRKYFSGALYVVFVFGLLFYYLSLPQQRSLFSNEHVLPPKPMVLYDGVHPFEEYKNLPKKDWHDYAAMKADEQREGPGEHGKPLAVAKDDEKLAKLREELYRQNGYDGYASDQIALNRSIKDIRHKECKNEKYIEKLPTHNSTLLRSVYSVINRSPPGVVREVILVDDASTKPFLREPLTKYWRDVGLDHIVKVVRTEKREGLIRARQIGAHAASSEILIFLDAHSEANYNWLPPLIEPIALDYKTVVCPFVDVIDCDTYEIRPQDEGARGSFDWHFNYKRLPLTKEDEKHPTKPFDSPVMAGGYFAISTKWFWELGGYDEGLDIWGDELQRPDGFKLWQCHGRMVDAPCSRVAHIYRCKHVPFPNPGVGDFISRNYKRVAEVWMDEYKHHLYKRRSGMENAEVGDLSKQKAIRDRLKCKSFDWFMKNVAFDQDRYYPRIEPPDSANGELKNLAAKKCVDTQFKNAGDRFDLRKCISEDPSGGGEQNLRMSFWYDVRPKSRNVCFDVSESKDHSPVVLFGCHGMKGNQHFKYRIATKQLHHPVSNLCMDCDPERGEIFMSRCDSSSLTQRWEWQNLNESVMEERNKVQP